MPGRQTAVDSDLTIASPNLLSLPAEAYNLMFQEFQEASASGDIQRLNRIVGGWLVTAHLYESDELNTALDTSEGFRLIHSRLLHLLQRDEEEEEQTFPSSYAFHAVLALLLGAFRHLRDLPRASITADETKGVRVQWINSERQVRLVVPAELSGRQYLYFETDKNYDLEDNPSPMQLAERLQWFSE